MKNKTIFIKFTSLLLIIALLFSFAGCKKETVEEPEKEPSSVVDSTSEAGDTSSNIESEDSNSSLESKDETSSNVDNLINNSDEDLFEDLDLTVYQSVKFDNVAEQKNYAGMTGLLPPFWYLPDSTMENPYTEEQIAISVKKFLQMGVTTVRCHGLSFVMAWDGEKDKWDWDSEWMKGFYKYCDLMKENNIEIIWNPPEVGYGTNAEYGLESPFPVLGKQQYPEIFSNYKSNDPTNEQKEIMIQMYGQWVVDFYKEVVIKRGYDNIKYFEPGTEPNNSTDGWTDEQIREDYESWVEVISACHKAMEKAGYRNKIDFVGPSVVIPGPNTKAKSAYMWLEWCVNEIDHMIDIYAVHQYWRPEASTQDFSDYFHEIYIDPCMEIVKTTGKPLWCDELNVDDANYTGMHITRNDPLMATQLAHAYTQHMISGIQSSPIWYLVDIKWPNRVLTGTDGWQEGIHKCGIDVSVLESTIPSNGYYVYCMLGQTVRKGDTVYAGKSELGNVYSVMLKHTDGTYSFISINLGWEENTITYELPIELENCTYEKTVYDPMTFKANSLYRPIEPSKTIKNVNNSFTDNIGAYQVCVYNLK